MNLFSIAAATVVIAAILKVLGVGFMSTVPWLAIVGVAGATAVLWLVMVLVILMAAAS